MLISPAAAGDAVKDVTLPVKAEALVDRTSVTIGEKIRYTITVKAEKGFEVEFPEFGENLAEFTIKDFGSKEGGLFSREFSQWYILDAFETGTFTIPSAVVKFRQEGAEEWKGVATKNIDIEILSLLDEDDQKGDIKEIRGPVTIRNLQYLYIIAIVLAVILAVFIILRLLKRRKKAVETLPPPTPAHELAFEALMKLKRKNYLEKGKTQEYYIELSDIVRHYMENRFSLRAPEMTTEEFLSDLKNSDVLKPEQKDLISEFLSHCDMVKFARYLPGESESESSYHSAEELIKQTKVSDMEVTAS